jgi:hypothetical protein
MSLCCLKFFVPNPKIATYSVNVIAEGESNLFADLVEYPSCQLGMFPVISRLNAVLEAHVQVKALAAGALANFDAWDRFDCLANLHEVIVGYANAFGVAGNCVEVESHISRQAMLPVPARRSDPDCVQVQWPS